MSAEGTAAGAGAGVVSSRDLAVARGLDQARSRAEHRVQLFLDAARELQRGDSGEFTVQEVVERSGQSLRTFYQYFGGKHALLLALFEESIRAAAEHLESVVGDVADPLERVHRFVVEYFTMCRLGRDGRPPGSPEPAMVEFAQQLLTSHPEDAARAFAPVRELLERLLAEATASGALRSGLDRRRVAGVVLQATMFNTFGLTISGAVPHLDIRADLRADAELCWELLLVGLAPDDRGTRARR